MRDSNAAFTLSPSGNLRYAVATALILAQSVQFAGAAGLTAATGPGGTPQIQSQNGVPVINIVAPTGSGLSHNQFLDYNVAQSGVVLNNALAQGGSVLAGKLGANPQFQGQAASVILNEVVSRNASSIGGAQEIFGRPADYVLANPNGITVNGASFINTPNASLVVGRPDVVGGSLRGVNTQDATGNLSIRGSGLSNDGGSLNLLAPQIDSTGNLRARDDLKLTVGRNVVDYPSGEIHTATAADAAQRIDASLFGAMQAGRINIVSTAEGAGVRVGSGKLEGRSGVSVSSAGDVDISGQVTDNVAKAQRAGVASDGDVNLHAKRDLHVAAADIQGRNLIADAGRDLILDSLESTQTTETHNTPKKSFLGITYEKTDQVIVDKKTRQDGVVITASQDASLNAARDVALKGATVKTGKDLHVTAKNDIRLTASTEADDVHDKGVHSKYLWKGEWDNTQHTERSVGSQLLADGAATVSGVGNVSLEGALVKSQGDLLIDAGRQLTVGAASRNETSNIQTNAGDLVNGIFFNNKVTSTQNNTLQQGSQIVADGNLVIAADQVHVSGSQVRGKGNTRVTSTGGALVVDGVNEVRHSQSRNEDRKLSGVITTNTDTEVTESKFKGSDLSSDGNLQLSSASDLDVIGSLAQATGQLSLNALGKITLASAQDTTSKVVTEETLGFKPYAKEEEAGSLQYRAGVGYEQNLTTTQNNSVTQQGAVLRGQGVEVATDLDLTSRGSSIKAGGAGAQISARNINLLAEQNSNTTVTSITTTGASLYLTAGLDRLGVGGEGGRTTVDSSDITTTASASTVASAGTLNIDAGKGEGVLKTQGAQITATDNLNVRAGQVENQAAINTHTTTQADKSWNVDIGINGEFTGITRPIQHAINVIRGQVGAITALAAIDPIAAGKAVLAAVQGNGGVLAELSKPLSPNTIVDAGKSLADDGLSILQTLSGFALPNTGGNVRVQYEQGSSKTEATHAVASSFEGGGVDLNVQGDLKDEGTRYAASAGQLHVNANSQALNAAYDTKTSISNRLGVDTSLRAYTTTGQDLAVRVNGTADYQSASDNVKAAAVGSLYGSQGIQVQLGTDGAYEGTKIDGGTGDVVIQAGNSLQLNQANSLASASSQQVNGTVNASVSIANVPAILSALLSGSVGGGFSGNYQALKSESSTAQVSGVKGQNLLLASGDDLILQGSQLGSASQPLTDVALKAGGRLEYLAATSGSEVTGWNLGGVLNLGVGLSSPSAFTLANLDGHLNGGQIKQVTHSTDGGTINAGSVELIGSASNAQALHLQGTQIKADTVKLTADQGGILLDSARSTTTQNDWGAGLGLGLDIRNTTIGANLATGSSDEQQYSLIDSGQVILNSQGDTTLSGAVIKAGRVEGQVAGDLKIESVREAQQQLDAKVDLSVLNGISDPHLSLDGSYSRKEGVDVESGIYADQGIDLGASRVISNPLSAVGVDLSIGGGVLLSTTEVKAHVDEAKLGLDL
ncbi:filamentous hemagglutinin [Pseudomonas palleroniana]|uniref:Filamentous hemagglutinin n=1 Tax=Pseudomonas palleroniana TaxID=191390 RepID=A0A2L1J5N0_9PSED|nr:hemagglutinin repeat-containing protein [Pseudomonas palleroniana]AVE03785.1 filamentous hemagglutinin [Pseudomonas palleroniana]